MITKLTIDKIMEATDIVEVVGEFVQLKKRGANYVGLSPFSNERTPSFTVSPAKGIFKDFSSSKGGSAITFLMDLEKFTYPEALKWLAKKYGIEVEEILDKPENKEEETRRESLMVATAYAAKFFQDTLWDSDEGKNIGLSYFKERAFTPETIRKFELGYSPDQWEAFTGKALKEGYKEEFLTEAGLSVKRDNGSLYDRYRGRVMFPIHSMTGRVIAFGGRTLKNDKSVPKYVNSPESDIYHKSNVLYGLYFAKKAIRDEDNCYLVEGYADVISVHQAGIENVVASSGTSLTVEQIRLIGRLTKNITILYDGDAAGIKASLRGLDLILEEGLNVKVVLFPDGNDPDSYVRQLGSSAFRKYIDDNRKDFILFKTSILLKDAANDPIKRAGVIREVVESIAKIPDSIMASVFIKECSMLMQIDERALLTELNKMRLAKAKKENNSSSNQQQQYTPSRHPDEPPPDFYEQFDPSIPSSGPDFSDYAREAAPRPDGELQEREIVRLLILYGNQMVELDANNNTSTYIGPFIVGMLDDVEFEHENCRKFVDLYKQQVEKGDLPDDQFFIHQQDKQIVDMTIDMLTPLYILSDNWVAMHSITTNDEQRDLKATIMNGVYHLKKHKVSKILEKLLHDLQTCTSETDIELLQGQYIFMKKVERKIADELGIVILR